MQKWLLIVSVFLAGVNGIVFYNVKPKHQFTPPPISMREMQEIERNQRPEPVKPINIDFVCPTGDMSFQDINAQLKKWAEQAPAFVEYGTYGKTQNGTAIPYLRLCLKTGLRFEEHTTKVRPKVLITSCIHGNEHLSAMVTMGCIGNIIKNHADWMDVLSEREIIYIPVICPESYQRVSRHDMNVDPNRNFADRRNQDVRSIPSIASLKEFFLAHKFKAVMSCHNHGKVYLYPWGYTNRATEINQDYKRILGKMSAVTHYDAEQLLRQSAPPYYGYEVDWFHKNGAFAIVNEIGTRFEATNAEIKKEVETNLLAFRIFIKEAPIVR